jgi:alkylation response protein AidB-like acyl-CoA dehydrogenase
MEPERYADPGRFGFELTEDQQMIRQAARQFARGKLAESAAERDRSREYPVELVRELGEMGLLAMRVPLEWGGPGCDATGYALALEALGEADGAIAAIVAASNLVGAILAAYGNDEQRHRWLPDYSAGKLGPAAFCLTEPHTGSDAAAIRTRARPDGDDYVLDGAKMWITNGTDAGIYMVFAKTDPGSGTRGISCFIVERGTSGLVVGTDEPKMGLRCSGTAALFFEDCRVPAANMVGQLGLGYRAALGALGPGRVGIAAQAVGIGEAAFREGMTYATDRKAFGKRLVDFQNSQFVLADCRTELDAAWLLTLRAARLMDTGHRAAIESSMAKAYATEACGRVVDKMLQLHGGYGYSEEYTIERLYRDARVTRIYEGTNEIQRLVMAREMLRG